MEIQTLLSKMGKENIFHVLQLITWMLRSKKIIKVIKEFQIHFHIIMCPMMPVTWTKNIMSFLSFQQSLFHSMSLGQVMGSIYPLLSPWKLFQGHVHYLNFVIPGFPDVNNFLKGHYLGHKRYKPSIKDQSSKSPVIHFNDKVAIRQPESMGYNWEKVTMLGRKTVSHMLFVYLSNSKPETVQHNKDIQ